jgi:phosphotriesterase-related protein
VDVADLGPTYMHEHIFVLTTDVQQNYPGEWGSEDARITDAVTKLGALAAQGVRTIVDPTVVGLGRNLPRIQRVAEQVPELNIIVATGLYTYDSVPFFFYHRGPALNEALGTEVPDPWWICSWATSRRALPARGSRRACSSAPSTSMA